jgi:hypothetical protein
MSDDDRREGQLNSIVETLAQIAEQQRQTTQQQRDAATRADRDAAESAERDRRRERQIDFILEQQARDVTQDARRDLRLDRIERIAKLFANAGRRARREARDQDRHISALVEAQLHTEANVAQLANTVRAIVTERNGNGNGADDAA